MIIVSGTATIKPGGWDEIQNDVAAMITASRAETGCIDYRYGVDVLTPTEIVVLEYWESWDALDAHFKTQHMAAWREALGKVIVSRNLTAIEAGESRDI